MSTHHASLLMDAGELPKALSPDAKRYFSVHMSDSLLSTHICFDRPIISFEIT